MIKSTKLWEHDHYKTRSWDLMIMEYTSHHIFDNNFYKEKVLL